MRLLVKLSFSSEGTSPLDIVRSMNDIGFNQVFGDYDFAINFKDPEQYGEIVTKLHKTLQGAKVYYSLTTKKE